jgi:crotonobetainyl-CoA:carnitine CoA-transferase CaiB-like acyl-CoA transferase
MALKADSSPGRDLDDGVEAVALAGIRICDLTGQLAGAGATRLLAALGAQVIRVEDPVREGRWDLLRGLEPFVDERRGIDLGVGFNNHNVEKLGVTLNLRSPRGRELFAALVEISDAVTENFAAGVLARLGFSYEALKALRPDIVYVSNSGFGYRGPYREFKSWGPIVQAVSGLTFSSGLPGRDPAGWGYSYMDHQGANFMAIALLAALVHRGRTGEGQWVDMSCTDAGASLCGPAMLDYTVNGRPLRREGMPDSNHSQSPEMAPHDIYPARGRDSWIAVACRDDSDWRVLASLIGEGWAQDPRFERLEGRLAHQEELDRLMAGYTRSREKFALAARIREAGVPASAVQTPEERIEQDDSTRAFGLWPTVTHSKIGRVRVDGLPFHLSRTDGRIQRGAPCLGEHNDYVFGELLGIGQGELDALREEGVL